MTSRWRTPDRSPEKARKHSYGGALTAYGLLQSWRDSLAVLQIVDKLDASPLKLLHMSHYRRRAEHHASD